ncbi:MAG: hypothetical protein MRZ14_04005 [Clostridiales bacterium]|nr:hypothetical protein [Clostridiales bacterium]
MHCKKCGTFYSRSSGECPRCAAKHEGGERDERPVPKEEVKRSWILLIIAIPAFIGFFYFMFFMIELMAAR